MSDEAWYSQNLSEPEKYHDIIIGQYFADGSTKGEMSITWNDLAPKLEVYKSSFQTLNEMPELFTTLSSFKGTEFIQQDLVNALIENGYQDITERTKSIERGKSL